jgi:surface antigen/peptidoglycan hydrolase CwlO-like protein
MLKQKSKIKTNFRVLTIILTAALVVGGGSFALADQFDEQIKKLQAENAEHQEESSELADQAASYQDAIDKLEGQINGLQQAIVANQKKSDALQTEIDKQQKELDHQKYVLGQNIKTMYLEGQISTLEILAASKDLSEFVDKQQYRNAVQDQVKTTVDKITALKVELEKKQRELQTLIKEQESQKAELAEARAQQSELLAYTEDQKASYDKAIKNNQDEISELRRQQIAANAAIFGGVIPGSGKNCGGGYPGKANGPWGPWGCNYPKDYSIDNWGMYNRECVSYTAVRVAASGRHMPYWGGQGDAHLWDNNAERAGIPVYYSPSQANEGDVAISNSGTWGHAMYVEHVYEDGRILVSQYNVGLDGRYSEAVISGNGLSFIRFP